MTAIARSLSLAARKIQGWHTGNRDLTNRLALGAFWGIVGVVLEKVTTLAVVVITVRILQREQYGLLSILQSTTATLSVFAMFGMGTTVTRFVAKLRGNDAVATKEIVSLLYYTALFVSIFVFFAVIAGSDIIARSVISQPQLSPHLTLLSIAIIFSTMDGMQQGVLLGYEEIRKIGILNFAAVLLSAPVQIILTWRFGITGAVCGLILAAFMRWLFSGMLMLRHTKIYPIKKYRDFFSKHNEILRNYAWPAMMSGLMITPVHWICHGMLMRSGNGAREMAVVGVANQWFYIILFLPAAAGKVLLPILSEMSGSDTKNSKNILLLNILCNVIVVAPVVAVIAAFGKWIVGQYGADFSGQAPVLLLYSIAAAMAATCLPLGYYLAAKGGMWSAFTINAGWALIYIFCSHNMISLGAMGLATGISVAYAFHLISTSFCVWHATRQA